MKKRPTRREPETAHHRGLKITFDDNLVARSLFGEQNRHLRQIADVLAIQIHARGNTVTVHGDDIATQLVKRLLNELYGLIEEGYPIYEGDIDYAIRILSSNDRIKLKNIFLDTVYITSQKRPITPKGLAQKEYIDTMRKFDIVFAIGPAGTGKTYLACALAHKAFLQGFSSYYTRIPRIVPELVIARGDGSFSKRINELAKMDVIILDDWGLITLAAEHRRDLLEILDDRHDRTSTIVTSQLPIKLWHEIINDSTLADAILDRIIHNAYRIELKGDSMRKLKFTLTNGGDK